MKIHLSCSVALAGLVVFLHSADSSEQSPPDTIREGAKGDLKVLIETAKSAWAYADDKKENFGVDLEQLSAMAVSRFDSCRDQTEVFEVLREVVAALKDGH